MLHLEKIIKVNNCQLNWFDENWLSYPTELRPLKSHCIALIFTLGAVMISGSGIAAGAMLPRGGNPRGHSQQHRHTGRTYMAPSRGLASSYQAEFRGNTKTQGRILIQGSGTWSCYGKKCETTSLKSFDVASCQQLARSQGFIVSFIHFNGGTQQTQRFNRTQLNQCNGGNRHAKPVIVHVGQAAADRVRTTSLILLGNSSANESAPNTIKTSALILLGQSNNGSPAKDRIKTSPLILLGNSSGNKSAPNTIKTSALILLG